MRKKKILFVVNSCSFFISHRIEIAKEAIRRGYKVYLACSEDKTVKKVHDLGISFINLNIDRKGMNPVKELKLIFDLRNIFKTVKPDLVHLISIKPIIYGGLIAKFYKACIVYAISGLGTVFIDETLLGRIRKKIILYLYKISLRQKKSIVIFQNPDDKDILIGNSTKHKYRYIDGSGVCLEHFHPQTEPSRIRIIMVSRILKDKGIYEFLNAAKIINSKNIIVEMAVVGSIDTNNSTSLTQEEIDKYKSENLVNFVGFKENTFKEYANSNIVCLPSYREGFPKTLIEAAASGRAIVTTDVPGCRECVIPNVSGLLVPSKNSKLLALALIKLIQNDQLRRDMGANGRILAEEKFSITKIVDEHFKIYDELLDVKIGG